jgi:hypothetical protein
VTRDLVSKVVEGAFAETIKVRIPGTAGPNVKAAIACLLDDFVASVFNGDGIFLAKLCCLGKYDVKGAVELTALLDEIQVFAAVVGDATDPQVRQLSELQYSFPGNEGFKGDGRGAEEMSVFRDDRFDCVVVSSEEAAVFT